MLATNLATRGSSSNPSHDRRNRPMADLPDGPACVTAPGRAMYRCRNRMADAKQAVQNPAPVYCSRNRGVWRSVMMYDTKYAKPTSPPSHTIRAAHRESARWPNLLTRPRPAMTTAMGMSSSIARACRPARHGSSGDIGGETGHQELDARGVWSRPRSATAVR